MKNKTGLLFITCLLSFGLFAAESETELAEEPESTSDEFLTEPLDETEQVTDEENSEVASDENFVPTIRITEDLPVAFPVDI